MNTSLIVVPVVPVAIFRKSKGLDFTLKVESRPLGSNYRFVKETINLITVPTRYVLAAHFLPYLTYDVF